MLTFEFFIEPLIIGAWAFLFADVLQKPGEVFYWFRKGLCMLDSDYRKGKTSIANEKNIKGVKYILWKWGTCAKCHAGVSGLLFSMYAMPCKCIWFEFIVMSIFFGYLFSKVFDE